MKRTQNQVKKHSKDRVVMGKIAWKIVKGLIQYRDFRHIDILMPP